MVKNLPEREVKKSCKRQEFDGWVRKIPWRRKWQPTPVSCLGNPMDRGAWQATVQGIVKSQTDLLTKHTCIRDWRRGILDRGVPIFATVDQ